MQRRSFLQALAALPFGGGVVKAPAAKAEQPRTLAVWTRARKEIVFRIFSCQTTSRGLAPAGIHPANGRQKNALLESGRIRPGDMVYYDPTTGWYYASRPNPKPQFNSLLN
jgi:hypothetical protein